jgi:hypothetical protein
MFLALDAPGASEGGLRGRRSGPDGGGPAARQHRHLPEASLVIVAWTSGIVDEAAAVRRVREGRLRGGDFDVFEQEPLFLP